MSPMGPMPDPSRALRGALKLCEQGIACFPCGAHKRPTTPHGFKEATAEISGLRRLWLDYPGHLVGVPTGQPNGFDVIDIDARNGGATWFATNRPRLEQNRIHRTRSGGLHIFFQHEPLQRCSAGKVAPGVDVRADGGYIIWWPAAGFRVLADYPLKPWPAWLSAPEPRPRQPATTRIPDSRSLTAIARAVAQAPEGERNRVAYWGACRAGEMVASGLLPFDSALALIAEAASRAGLPTAEARRTAISGIKAGGRANV